MRLAARCLLCALVCACHPALSASADVSLIDQTYGVGAGSFELGNFNNTDVDSRPELMRLFSGVTNITGWTITGGTLGGDWLDKSLGGAAAGNVSNGNRSIDMVGQNPNGPIGIYSSIV